MIPSSRLTDMNEQIDRLATPAQRFGALMLDSMERLSDVQLGLMRSYTHYSICQWRDALEVRDPQSLQAYIEKRGEAARELGEQLSENAQTFMAIGQDFASRAGWVAQRNVERFADATQAVAERESDRSQRSRRAQ